MPEISGIMAKMDCEAFTAACRELGIELTGDRLAKFSGFEEDLYRVNSVMNLTRVPKQESWLRHFVDSVLIQEWIPKGVKVLDIGTGPGFPSWPLAVARPDLSVTALDSSGKMLGFLRTHPLPNLTVVEARAEQWQHEPDFDVVTGRAVAPLGIQLELSAPMLKEGGIALPMRTLNDLEAIQRFAAGKLGLVLNTIHQRTLPGTDIIRVFPEFEKVKATPKQYPRSWAEIKKKPIS